MVEADKAGCRAMPSRRALLAGAAGLVLAPAWPCRLAQAGGPARALVPASASASASGTDRDLAFAVRRDGNPIGSHEIRFRSEGALLQVDVRIELAVEMLLFTAFRYSHSNRETWGPGGLLEIRTRTDDDGTAFSLQGRSTPAGLLVEAGEGPVLLPAGLLPSSWWHPDTVRRDRLLNTQDGTLLHLAIEAAGPEAIPGDGGRIPAQRYLCRGDLDLDMWRDDQNRLAGLRFKAPTDGSVIDYLRLPPAG